MWIIHMFYNTVLEGMIQHSPFLKRVHLSSHVVRHVGKYEAHSGRGVINPRSTMISHQEEVDNGDTPSCRSSAAFTPPSPSILSANPTNSSAHTFTAREREREFKEMDVQCPRGRRCSRV